MLAIPIRACHRHVLYVTIIVRHYCPLLLSVTIIVSSVTIIICHYHYLSLSLSVTIIICHYHYLSLSLSVTIIICHYHYTLSVLVAFLEQWSSDQSLDPLLLLLLTDS